MNDDPGRQEAVIADDEGLHAFVAVATELTDEEREPVIGDAEKATGKPIVNSPDSPAEKTLAPINLRPRSCISIGS
ncbi:MAG: hypothetical protein IPK78_13195 [Rhodospirillales bacterium]|nr:hypothetical protein [Rhodospirillales bacterium]